MSRLSYLCQNCVGLQAALQFAERLSILVLRWASDPDWQLLRVHGSGFLNAGFIRELVSGFRW